MDEDTRSAERLRYHFDVERELADRLRWSTPEERRRGLYTEVYNELFQRVPDHPQNLRKYRECRAEIELQLKMLLHYLRPTYRYLEIGAGDCALAFRVAEYISEATAVEISDVISASITRPANFQLVITDGVHIPLPTASIDVAYSNQLMEHLHLDDAVLQLKELRRVLRPRGVYLCITPSRLTGPHDISGRFTEVACGFHLKEYVYREFVPMLRHAGFSAARVVLSKGGRPLIELPPSPFMALEWIVERAPCTVRRHVRLNYWTQVLFGMVVAAYA
jgi:SAM-dependent methyltransferase